MVVDLVASLAMVEVLMGHIALKPTAHWPDQLRSGLMWMLGPV